MNHYKLIASLHYQLAEAYAALAKEQEESKPRAKLVRVTRTDPAAESAIKRVQQGLRTQGFKT